MSHPAPGRWCSCPEGGRGGSAYVTKTVPVGPGRNGRVKTPRRHVSAWSADDCRHFEAEMERKHIADVREQNGAKYYEIK